MKFWKSGKIRNLLVVAVFALLMAPITARAVTMSIAINEYTGHEAKVYTSIEEYNGSLNVGIELISSDFTDIRAFFATVANKSALSSLSVSGTDVIASNIRENNVLSAGGSSISSSGAGGSDQFDIGVEFETPNDEVSFILSDASDPNNDNPLSAENLSEQTIGIVLENGNDEMIELTALLPEIQSDDTEDDSLVVCFFEPEIEDEDDFMCFADPTTLPDGGPEEEIINVVNPEPTTVLLLGIGLAGMAGVSLRRMRKTAQRKKPNQ